MNTKIKKERGITLIALVITVIVLLILAGVSISTLGGKDGIISNAETAAEKAKISDIEEKLNLELIELETESSSRKITIEKYLERLQEKDIIDESDIEEAEEGKEIIVDGEFIFLVYYNTVEEIKIEYIGKAGAIKPSITLVSISNTTNTITVEVSTKRNEGGMIEYYYKTEEDTNYTLYKETENTTLIYEKLEQNKNYNLKIVAVASNGQTDEVLVSRTTGNVTEIQEGDIKFTFDPEGWTNGEVTVTAEANIDITGFTLQTSKDATTWSSSASQTFETNGTMYVRVIDSEEQYNGTASTNVEKIDVLAPNTFTPTATSTINTITVTASTTDQDATTQYGKSDIAGYRFRVNSGTWSSYQTSGTYTFSGLSQATSYTVEVEAKDNAGNTTPGTVTISTKEVTIALSASSGYVKVGGTKTITASGSNYGSVSVSSSNTSVATVSVSGTTITITGKATGTTTIAAAATNNTSKIATYTIYVTSLTAPSTTSHTLEIGGTVTLTAPTKSTYAGTITYTSSNTSVATVTSSGVVTAVAGGTATITAREGNGGATVTYTITVNKNQLLANRVSKGDYVNYPVTYSNVSAFCGYSSSDTGWRVLYVKDNCVYLVSQSDPIGYWGKTFSSALTISGLDTWLGRTSNFADYVNSSYASSARGLIKTDLDTYYGSTLTSGTTYSDSLIKNGTCYYLSKVNDSSIWYVYGSGLLSTDSMLANWVDGTGSANGCFGIRVVVKLNSNVRTTGQSSSVWQLTTSTGN